MKALQDRVSRLLTTEAVQRFDAIMEEVVESQGMFEELGKLVHRRDGMQFRINTSLARRGGLTVDVRVAGRSVGLLHVVTKQQRRFLPHPKNFVDLRVWNEECDWSDHRVADYIESVRCAAVAGMRPEFTPEARVEATFIESFASVTKAEWTRDIELVRIGPLPYQVPVPVGGSEKARQNEGGLGYIDALARFGRGHGFQVFELKQPQATQDDAYLATEQAAVYVLALRELLLDRESMGYRRALAPNADGKVRDGLRFIASPFVPIAARQGAVDACSTLNKNRVDGVELRPIYYDWNAATSELSIASSSD